MVKINVILSGNLLCCFSAPDHFRAKNNKVYYEDVIRGRILAKRQRKNDTEINDSTNLKLIQISSNGKSYQINNNKRTDEDFEEQESYEKLCRQNGPQV